LLAQRCKGTVAARLPAKLPRLGAVIQRPRGHTPENTMFFMSPYLTPILLLIGSNVFMTTAWYWHLRYKDVPLFYVILISWGLAFVEYCLAVPANRFGSAVYNAAQLKTIQEVITFVVFAAFSYVYLREPITLSQGFGFTLIAAGAFFVFHRW
jgi:uncharacterized protein (DUF486 family)